MKVDDDIRRVANLIQRSKKRVVLTGAGISTPSGIPDFRSAKSGLWSKQDPFKVASLFAFHKRPQDFFDWIRPLAEKILEAEPNSAHIGLAQLEEKRFIQTILTQNIDGLHQKAGSENVLELHGSWENSTCINCHLTFSNLIFIQAFIEMGKIPTCPECGGRLKPDLILMGEQLPQSTWLRALEDSKSCDLMIVAGSSLEVMPAAGLPLEAYENGAQVIVINNMRTYIDDRADTVFREDVAEIVPKIAEQVLRANKF